MGGASQAAIGTVELTVLHRLAYKKKKRLQLYVQGLLLFAAVCYNTAWQLLGPVFPLEEPGSRAYDMSTWPCGFAHTAPCCSLNDYAFPGLYFCSCIPHPDPHPIPTWESLSSLFHIPLFGKDNLLRLHLLRVSCSVTSSMRPSLPLPGRADSSLVGAFHCALYRYLSQCL